MIHSGRRLKAAAAAYGGAAHDAQMGVKDFTGLFVLWLSGTALALLVSVAKSVYACKKRLGHPLALGGTRESISTSPTHGSLDFDIEVTAEKMAAARKVQQPCCSPPSAASPSASSPASINQASASSPRAAAARKIQDRSRTAPDEMDRSRDKRSATLMSSVFGRSEPVIPHFDPTLDINNSSAMLRYLIKLADDSRQEEVRTACKVHELWDLLVQRAGRGEARSARHDELLAPPTKHPSESSMMV